MRLSQETLSRLPSDVLRPSRRAEASGIVHFGIGAFHRAHQAWYTDACLTDGESGWGICGVSMRSDSVARQLNPQDGLYTLTARTGGGAETRVIGAVREVLVAEPDREAIIARLAAPECRIASFTITEKGYGRALDGSLDRAAGAAGFYPLLEEALRRRRAQHLEGLTLLSCDNLSGNGAILGRLVAEWLDAADPALARWFASECTTPDTMVDRIVPAAHPGDLDALAASLGMEDEGAVFTEPFSQWVIEDRFAGPRPGWERHGVQIVAHVASYETAKLRMLNGVHSLLAYCGLQRGHQFVHEAIADPVLRAMAEALMREEAAPTIVAGPDQQLDAYADDLFARFGNAALNHRLAQIAMDGSQKIPQRWLATLADARRENRECPVILTAIGAWLRHVRGDHGTVNDPLADKLKAVWAKAGRHGIVDAIFGSRGIMASEWVPTPDDCAFIAALPALADA